MVVDFVISDWVIVKILCGLSIVWQKLPQHHLMYEIMMKEWSMRDYMKYMEPTIKRESDIMQHNDVSPIHTLFLISFLSICYLHNMQRIFILLHIDQMILLPCCCSSSQHDVIHLSIILHFLLLLVLTNHHCYCYH